MRIVDNSGKVHFREGQVVHHKHYDYRGVVYSIDSECKADDVWYALNASQPNRDQAWYHVLVDGGAETYVAQENLELDTSGQRVDHPMIAKLFPTFMNGKYFWDSLN